MDVGVSTLVGGGRDVSVIVGVTDMLVGGGTVDGPGAG